MDPAITLQFERLVASARTRIASHLEHKDDASMRAACFACGRALGFHMAHKHPTEWMDAMDTLQVECYEKVGIC